MSDPSPTSPGQPPEAPYRDPDSPQVGFLRETEGLRPQLHRYCTRMLGSALDGEDVVQDALAAAFFRLDTVDSSQPLAPLLFRIAHNRCIDLLRRRRFESDQEPEDSISGDDLEHRAITDQQALLALEHLLHALPPRERSCFLLKDVLEHTLAETAEIVGCSTGAVKSALHRARDKLARLRDSPSDGFVPPPVTDRETLAVLERYATCFNKRAWNELAELLADDARLDVVGVLEDGDREHILDSYRRNYAALEGSWRLVPGRVDHEPVLLCLRRLPGQRDESVGWPIRVIVERGQVRGLRDYVIQSRLLELATVELP